MRKLKIREIFLITSLSVILTGCTNKSALPESETKNDIIVQESIVDDKESSLVTEIVEDTKQIIGSTSENDVQALMYFEEAKDELINLGNNEEFQKIKTKGKEYFITGIDFIFFDQPINNVYFKDLTTDLKIYTIEELAKIDKAIMEYYPNYKEEISTKYNIAAEFLDAKYLSVLDSIKEYLGEENYNAIGNIKDIIKSSAEDAYEDATSYLKKIYSEWKNK